MLLLFVLDVLVKGVVGVKLIVTESGVEVPYDAKYIQELQAEEKKALKAQEEFDESVNV